ncbi:hypothetical protein GCK72_021447 [Caenorhabditis remanei]|uniref:DUF38 domain-containing protein n=1 Tax=Caenorhabditis remanei TaxID=31234 RepID=A0A6A5GK53_CAERE|nr:hypothetical protein GCK72_021447 [Caenorhabditis remanei]KAF1754882.1 hypothetical protein GCK72_021447 [Caenorhabditis remanei]
MVETATIPPSEIPILKFCDLEPSADVQENISIIELPGHATTPSTKEDSTSELSDSIPPIPAKKEVSIMDMPDLVVREILRPFHFDFVSIHKLRKVCRALRDYLDDLKMISNVTSVNIKVDVHGIKVVEKVLGGVITSEYKNHKDGCEVTCDGQTTIIINGDFIDAFIGDFLWAILSNQETLLDKFIMKGPRDAKKFFAATIDKLFDRLILVLESRNRLLQIKHLEVFARRPDQVTQLLRHIDLEFLEFLSGDRVSVDDCYLEHPNGYYCNLDMLKDCKNLKELCFYCFTTTTPLAFLLHIAKIHVDLASLSRNDMWRLKEIILESRYYTFTSTIYFFDEGIYLKDLDFDEWGTGSTNDHFSLETCEYNSIILWRHLN